METFDDFRAEEAFKLLTEMAGVGQVIYLSHHQHLCDIARTVCPEVRGYEVTRVDVVEAYDRALDAASRLNKIEDVID